ncbi:MAG TPA: hypothetical protein VFM44_00365 [Gemmatimonadota bacterium]|nr:hypothetical protein [Gemmatimonadota bacterium]
MSGARTFVGALLVLFAGPAARAQEAPIDLAEARRAFDAAENASDLDGGKLWGTELYGPLFLVDPGSRSVVANRPDPEDLLREEHGVWVGVLSEEVNPANAAVDWAGLRWTMVLWPPPSIPHARNRLLIHESFHRIQEDVGLAADNPPNGHLDTRDGRFWMRLEMRALAEALASRGSGRAASIRDALDFRARRRSLFPEAAAEEDALERNEGMAEYTGLVLSGLPSEVLADRAAVELERREASDSFSRSFAYATGPAYGVLLDESSRPWREELVRGAALGDLLEAAYDTQPSPVPAEDRIAGYNGERVAAIETAREEERLAREADLRARFVEGPVLQLTPGAEFSFSFDPNDAVNLEGSGTVYGSARVTDVWGILEVDSGGALFLRNSQGWFTGVVVPVPAGGPDPPTAGEGWRLDLAEGWEIAPGVRADDWIVRELSAGS